MGLFLATIAWGNRKSIIQSGKKLIDIFENEPYYFVKSYDSSLTHKLTDFKHRTFNGFDLHFFIERLRDIYKKYESFSIIGLYFETIIKLGDFFFLKKKGRAAIPYNFSSLLLVHH